MTKFFDFTRKLKNYHWLIIGFVGAIIIGLGIGYTTDRLNNKNIEGTKTQITQPNPTAPPTINTTPTPSTTTNTTTTPKATTTAPKAPTTAKPTSTTSDYKPYIAPVCTQYSIPYKTSYKEIAVIYFPYVSDSVGAKGLGEKCTSDSLGSSPYERTLVEPFDRVIGVATRLAEGLNPEVIARITKCMESYKDTSETSTDYLKCYDDR